MNILKKIDLWGLWKNTRKPDFLDRSKIGKLYSNDLGFLNSTVKQTVFSEKSVFTLIVTFQKNDRVILSDNSS